MEHQIVTRNRTMIESLETAKLLNQAIVKSRILQRQNKDFSHFSLDLPDLGFGEGSFITAELAEMYFETIKDWRSKNSPSTKLVFEVMQKWMRYFKNELPEASDHIEFEITDYTIFWDLKEGEIEILGGKTELNDDQISLVQEIFGIGRSMLQRYENINVETKAVNYFGYRIFYRDKALRNETAHIEEKGFKIGDYPDMDSIWVEGGTEEISEEELNKIAASFYVTEFKGDLWNKPDGTKSYILDYGPQWAEYVGPSDL